MQDYKSKIGTPRRKTGRWIAAAAGLGLIAYALLSLSSPDRKPIVLQPVAQPQPLEIPPLAEPATLEESFGWPDSMASNAETDTPGTGEPIEQRTVLEREINAGDSMASIFSELDLDARVLHQILQIDKQTRQTLSHIKPGQQIQARVDEENDLQEFVYRIDPVRSLYIVNTGEGFESRLEERPVEQRIARQHGTINDSLFLDGQRAGLSDALIMELANIFGWDIDFALEIRSGDRFSVIYEEHLLDGEKLRDGPILAAEFVNRGKVYRAIRYQDPSGHADYYTPEGKSVRKAFLRMPVKFGRISSRFNLKRKHPILNRIRAHKGVDYAAATGTPVRAAGTGKIDFRGNKGGYGRTVVIEHGGGISTLYAHLSRYAKGRGKGTRVQQGQIVGYVGKSGLATGPHLHYEFRLNGVHRNPLTVKLPAAKPIAKKYREDFLAKSRSMIAQLETLNQTLVANAR